MSKRIVMVAVLLTMVVSFAGISASADNDVTIDTRGATPFVYEGRSYIPLKSAASFLGAPLQWDAAQNRAVMVYDGKELALTPGSRNALFEGRPVVLSAAPLVGGGRLFVPTDALRRTYGVPVEWDQARSRVRIKGPTGWGAVTVSRRPPGWVRGRKTGWGKHGDVTRPPGVSKKQGPPSVVVVPKAKVKSQKIEKGRDVGARGTPGPPAKERTRGRRGR
jgi:hypothetical protein